MELMAFNSKIQFREIAIQISRWSIEFKNSNSSIATKFVSTQRKASVLWLTEVMILDAAMDEVVGDKHKIELQCFKFERPKT